MKREQPDWLVLVSVAIYFTIMVSLWVSLSYISSDGTQEDFLVHMRFFFGILDGFGAVAGMSLLIPVHLAVSWVWTALLSPRS